jgi:phosphatidylglycerol lysyltransferase
MVSSTSSQHTAQRTAAEPDSTGAEPFRRRALRYAGSLLVIGLFVGALYILHRWLETYSIEDIRRALGRLPASQLVAAGVVGAASYWLLTLYDVLALRHLNRSLPYRWVALTAFTSYAFSHSFGFATIVGGSIRYRLYSPLGLSMLDVAQTTLFVVTTFTIGLIIVLPIVLAVEPMALVALNLPAETGTALGIIGLIALVAYLAAGWWLHKPLRVWGHDIAFPRPGIALGQVVLGLCDLMLAAAVLYLCLPPSPGTDYLDVLVIFGLALIAGIISHVPGGLGVFDAIVLVGLSGTMAGDDIVAGLLVFRVIYYLAPLIIAGLLFGFLEALRARARLSNLSRMVGTLVSPSVPLLLAACTFVNGAWLLFSRATPESTATTGLIPIPLPALEMGHFIGSIVGVLLILLAHALQRRLHAAWAVTLVLLAVGCLSALLTAGDWRAALMSGLIFAALLPSRDEFHRRGALLNQPFTAEWFAAVAVVLVSAFWLGLFSYKHVEFRDNLWWQFALNGDASRFLRASVAVGVVALVAALAHLLATVSSARKQRHAESNDAG